MHNHERRKKKLSMQLVHTKRFKKNGGSSTVSKRRFRIKGTWYLVLFESPKMTKTPIFLFFAEK